MGMSINRYFPAMGTAGLARILVKGYRRLPAPPPRMIAKTRFTKNYLSTANSLPKSSVRLYGTLDKGGEAKPTLSLGLG
jgi:hypothetical protein